MNNPKTSKPRAGRDADVQSTLDLDAGRDGTVLHIEHTFDTSIQGVEEQSTWQTETEPGSRSSARPRTGPDSPSPKRRGRGSLGVLMPTLLPSRPTFTGRGTSDLGSLAHALIGSHAQFLTHPDTSTGGAPVVPGDLLDRMYAVAYAVIDANPNATRVLATEAASLAFRYLREFPPAAPWELMAVEYETGNGPVDLAWVNDATGSIFFDEVKTSRVSTGRRVPDAWVNQSRRYSTAGAARFGEAFLGTRLVPLMAANTTRLVVALRPVVLLSPTAADPLRMAGAK